MPACGAMPLALATTPVAPMVPATWVAWSEKVLAESRIATRPPANSWWVLRTLASSQTPARRPAPVRPKGAGRSRSWSAPVEMAAAVLKVVR